MYTMAHRMGGKPGIILWAVGDIGAVGTIAAALAGWLPPFAAVIAIFWYLIQIRESLTVQVWMRRWRLRKLVKMRANAVQYELYLQQRNKDLIGLAGANKVHLAAETEAAAVTQDLMEKEEAGRSKAKTVAADARVTAASAAADLTHAPPT